MSGASAATPRLAPVVRLSSLPRIAAERPSLVPVSALSTMALLLGFLQSWHWRFTIGHGAISFLDMGEAYFRGDRPMEINGYFNPLYAWLLGLAVNALKPTPYWEYPLVHLVVFATYAFALFGFSFLLRELLRYRETTRQGRPTSGFLQPPTWVWLVLGYSIFSWVSLDLIRVRETNPDMLVAAFFYLACGLLVRIRRRSATWLTFGMLGVVLGLGYLTKSVFFPIALVFLPVAFVAAGGGRKAAIRLAVSALSFAVLAAPYIVALSLAKGRLTFGDAGRLNYAWCVNQVPMRHWQGSPDDGTPLHPTRRLFEQPATYEFGAPVGGTYPAVYDPSYWYDGLKPRFRLSKQLAALRTNALELGSMFLRLNGCLFLSAVLLALLSGRKRELVQGFRAYAFLLIPCLAGLLLYSLVLVYGRYVGAFVGIVTLVSFLAIPLPASREAARVMAGIAFLTLVMVLSPIGPSTIPKYLGAQPATLGSRDYPWEIAREITMIGLRPGDKVATTNYSKEPDMQWARLARVQIVGEVFYRPSMPQTHLNEFWAASPAVQEQILAAFARHGAKVVFSDDAPRGPLAGDASSGGWQRLGATSLFFHRLSSGRATPQ